MAEKEAKGDRWHPKPGRQRKEKVERKGHTVFTFHLSKHELGCNTERVLNPHPRHYAHTHKTEKRKGKKTYTQSWHTPPTHPEQKFWRLAWNSLAADNYLYSS